MALQKCPDCGGELENGSLIDRSGSLHTSQVYAVLDSAAASEEEKKSYIPKPFIKEWHTVNTMRCKQCNRLFPYAQANARGGAPALIGAKQLSNFILAVIVFSLILGLGGLLL